MPYGCSSGYFIICALSADSKSLWSLNTFCACLTHIEQPGLIYAVLLLQKVSLCSLTFLVRQQFPEAAAAAATVPIITVTSCI